MHLLEGPEINTGYLQVTSQAIVKDGTGAAVVHLPDTGATSTSVTFQGLAFGSDSTGELFFPLCDFRCAFVPAFLRSSAVKRSLVASVSRCSGLGFVRSHGEPDALPLRNHRVSLCPCNGCVSAKSLATFLQSHRIAFQDLCHLDHVHDVARCRRPAALLRCPLCGMQSRS